MDPNEIVKYATYSLTALGMITAVTLPLMRLAHWCKASADATPQTSDDVPAARFVRFAESLHGTMMKVRAFVRFIVDGAPR